MFLNDFSKPVATPGTNFGTKTVKIIFRLQCNITFLFILKGSTGTFVWTNTITTPKKNSEEFYVRAGF